MLIVTPCSKLLSMAQSENGGVGTGLEGLKKRQQSTARMFNDAAEEKRGVWNL